ncbi:MAG: class II aldolase/adducin family protein [Mogibacterium sp.]|nr:class II aldolase/adducin family protein [Mogibacterium sp.]MBR2539296.1 class II aldolase/adducin family protein [Mogibacterium sp.]
MYTEQEARRLVIEACHKLVKEKLVARTWGNISARISSNELLITPSGRAYENLRPEDLVVVRIDDLSYTGDIKPSSEKGIHAEAYKLRSDVNFIIHTHQFFASVLAAEGKNTKAAPCAAYGSPGTAKLIRNISKVLKAYPDDRAFLMSRHGALILGTDPEDAFARAAGLEAESKKVFMTRVMKDHSVSDSMALTNRFGLGANYVMLLQDQYVMECCNSGMRLLPYIDDFAQIAGVDVLCVDNKKDQIKRALKGRNAVLVRNLGAVCTGVTRDDAEAVASIVSKNAAAACYVRDPKPLSKILAIIERRVYVAKYSKRING